MRSIQIPGATDAPSPEVLRRARIEAAGVSPWMATALADLFFAAPKRDDLAALASVTASRCAAASVGVR